ncbi:MAG TPA: fructosamine kinase family protein [Burkholderiales bacterium]|nr:fructosamine kinase family protein [Burkholderiales bacterium]
MIPWNEIERDIGAATGAAFSIAQRSAAAGGCINAAWRIEGRGRRYFVKVNEASRAPMFEAEAAGLSELHRRGPVRVPEAICQGSAAAASWIVLEYIQLGARTVRSDAALGLKLAELHRHTAEMYGWPRDNTIGSTPQPNNCSSSWLTFWRDQRLGFQLRLARERGYCGKLHTKGTQLLEHVPAFFERYTPAPSLLHGDLWSGNAACDATETPVIFDPAVYYGDREADIAMTELFGGFSSSFYEAYREAYALDPGYAVRKDLYNLYHVLNHLNLFGGGYLRQAERMIDALLAEIR